MKTFIHFAFPIHIEMLWFDPNFMATNKQNDTKILISVGEFLNGVPLIMIIRGSKRQCVLKTAICVLKTAISAAIFYSSRIVFIGVSRVCLPFSCQLFLQTFRQIYNEKFVIGKLSIRLKIRTLITYFKNIFYLTANFKNWRSQNLTQCNLEIKPIIFFLIVTFLQFLAINPINYNHFTI